jgi:excisionase family DNA binding protein
LDLRSNEQVSEEVVETLSSVDQTRTDSYTMAEAARLKGVSYHTVSRAVRRGTLPAQRIGKMAFISAPDLQAWQPMVQRAPRKYRRRTPQLDGVPATIDLASAERVTWAEQIATIIETTRWTAQGLPIQHHLSLLVERLANALDMHRVTVWGIQESRNVACRMASYGPPATDFPEQVPLPLFPLLADMASRHGGQTPGFSSSSDDYSVQKSTTIMVMPLRYGDTFHGALIADRNGETFQLSADQFVLVRAVADQMAIALELASLRSEVCVAAD